MTSSTMSSPAPTVRASSGRKRKPTIPKPKDVSADDAALGYDLITQLTYMVNLAEAGLSRDNVFELTRSQPLKTAAPFQQIYLLVKRLGMEYVVAFQAVAKTTRSRLIKGLLLRFAGAIGSGESEQRFLISELRIELERYEEHYDRSLESLRKWGDAYASLLVSVTLIIVVAMITTMISNIGQGFVYALSLAMLAITFVGVWIIYRVPPQENKTYTYPAAIPKIRKWAFRLTWVVAVPGMVVGLGLMFTLGLGVGLLVVGLALMPTGILMYHDDLKVDGLDSDLSAVIRGLGATAASLGSTLAIAMQKVDRRSMGRLEPYINRLATRLFSRLSTEAAWKHFVGETGSDLVRRTVAAFYDPVSRGAPADTVANTAADYALRVSLLRARRRQVAATFAYLVVPLHASMVGLLLFIYQIVYLFNAKIGEISSDIDYGGATTQLPNLPYFHVSDLGPITALTYGVVLVLTVANGLAPSFALGGHRLKSFVYLGISCVTSGLALIAIPAASNSLLKF